MVISLKLYSNIIIFMQKNDLKHIYECRIVCTQATFQIGEEGQVTQSF